MVGPGGANECKHYGLFGPGLDRRVALLTGTTGAFGGQVAWFDTGTSTSRPRLDCVRTLPKHAAVVYGTHPARAALCSNREEVLRFHSAFHI